MFVNLKNFSDLNEALDDANKYIVNAHKIFSCNEKNYFNNSLCDKLVDVNCRNCYEGIK